MCGIAGIIVSEGKLSKFDAESLAACGTRMAAAISSRGPDDAGVWVNAAKGVALAHRRLSILDLSAEGHQPMLSASGRYVLSYNGEIYNHQALRAKLHYPWRGSSDTETLLAAIETWGVEKALAEINGMFAFAVWDTQAETLTLARDRMGEKPLYYGEINGCLVFGSELKAIRAGVDVPLTLNRDAMQLLMHYSYVPAPHSMYEGIYKLPPATFLTISPGHALAASQVYWSLPQMALSARHTPLALSDSQATDMLEGQLREAVGARMMADVPLGAFLSGGVDSSVLVALMQAQASRPAQTFTIGFEELGFNEAPYAKQVAEHLRTDHHELYLSAGDALEVIPQLPAIYDEPFADASQIPTYLVSKFARQHVTVALSGDGGDELFGGYNRHVKAPGLWNILSSIPAPLRALAARSFLAVQNAAKLGRGAQALANMFEKLDATTAEAFYRALCATHYASQGLVRGGVLTHEPLPERGSLSFAEWMMLADALTYFPGDIMAKVDRASMAVSLETRTPFTDPALIHFAWQLPMAQKIRGGQGKWLLREVLYRHVPKTLIDRPKAGFAVPIDHWLRGTLRDWAADLLSEATLTQQGFLNAQEVQRLWKAHQSGRRDASKPLWNILMFQSWLGSQ